MPAVSYCGKVKNTFNAFAQAYKNFKIKKIYSERQMKVNTSY